MEKLKACRNCRRLVPEDEKKCPVCGNESFTRFWRGMVIVIDPSCSEIAKEMGIEYPGPYAIRTAR